MKTWFEYLGNVWNSFKISLIFSYIKSSNPQQLSTYKTFSEVSVIANKVQGWKIWNSYQSYFWNATRTMTFGWSNNRWFIYWIKIDLEALQFLPAPCGSFQTKRSTKEKLYGKVYSPSLIRKCLMWVVHAIQLDLKVLWRCNSEIDFFVDALSQSDTHFHSTPLHSTLHKWLKCVISETHFSGKSKVENEQIRDGKQFRKKSPHVGINKIRSIGDLWFWLVIDRCKTISFSAPKQTKRLFFALS